ELMVVILDVHHTTNLLSLERALSYISANVERPTRDGKQVSQMLRLVMEHAIEYIILNKVDMRDLTFLFYMRNVYTSNRTSNPKLLELRKLGSEVIKKATNARNDAEAAATRTGVFLYILLRVFSRNYYVRRDRKSTRLNSSHVSISYAVFCLKKKTKQNNTHVR